MSAGAILTQGLGLFGSASRVLILGLNLSPVPPVVGCVQAMQVYQAGAIRRQVYQPGAAAAEVYQPGAQATQVGCE